MFAVESPRRWGGRKKTVKGAINIAPFNVRWCQLSCCPLLAGEKRCRLLPANVSSRCLRSAWRGCRPHSPWSVNADVLFLRLACCTGGHVLYQFVDVLQDGRGYNGSPGMPGHPGSPGVKGDQVSESLPPSSLWKTLQRLILILVFLHCAKC